MSFFTYTVIEINIYKILILISAKNQDIDCLHLYFINSVKLITVISRLVAASQTIATL